MTTCRLTGRRALSAPVGLLSLGIGVGLGFSSYGAQSEIRVRGFPLPLVAELHDGTPPVVPYHSARGWRHFARRAGLGVITASVVACSAWLRRQRRKGRAGGAVMPSPCGPLVAHGVRGSRGRYAHAAGRCRVGDLTGLPACGGDRTPRGRVRPIAGEHPGKRTGARSSTHRIGRETGQSSSPSHRHPALLALDHGVDHGSDGGRSRDRRPRAAAGTLCPPSISGSAGRAPCLARGRRRCSNWPGCGGRRAASWHDVEWLDSEGHPVRSRGVCCG